MVQPVEVTVRRGGTVSIMATDRGNVGVELGVQEVERVGLEEERQECALLFGSAGKEKFKLTQGSVSFLSPSYRVVEEVLNRVHRKS
jgi:hypothetical protein